MTDSNDEYFPKRVIAQGSLFQFRLLHLVYVLTLLGSALATFGAWGILWGGLVTLAWMIIYASQNRSRRLLLMVLLALVAFCCSGLMLVGFSTPARQTARRMMCANNMKQIALALHNYHDVYGCFPPAFVADEQGQPLHSWRVLLLPYLEEQPLYDAYDFDEPWNGPNNSKLLNQMPEVYACPTAVRERNLPENSTSYVAVTGRRTVWPGAESCAISDLSDQLGSTILVTECSSQRIPWLEPRDVDLQSAVELLRSPASGGEDEHVVEDFFYVFSSGRNVAFCDGSVLIVDSQIPSSFWVSALRIDDGQQWSQDEMRDLVIRKRLKLGNTIRLAIFVLLSILPLPWVFRS